MPNKKGKANYIDAYVGAKIKHYRVLMGFSQEKLAEAVNLTFQQIQKYENAKNRVAASRLYAIANALETPVGSFFPVEA